MEATYDYTIGRTDRRIGKMEKRFVVIEANKKILLRTILMFWLISVVFLFLRALLEGLGADPHSLFAGFIYALSDFIILPFIGIFPHFTNTIQPGKATFDAPALIAILCYTVLTFLGMIVVYILTRIVKTERQVDETLNKERIINPSNADSKIQ